ncbi:MAG: ABC transporter permease [Pseudomonadota bacterium]
MIRILDALVLREISGRFGHSRLGYLWAFLTPLLGIIALYIIFVNFRQGRTELPLFLFLVTGWTTYGLYQGTTSALAGAAEANKGLLMHPTITRLDVLSARSILEVLTAVALLLLYAFISLVFEGSRLPDRPGMVLISFLSAAAFGTSVGLILAALKTQFPMADKVVAPINRVGFFVSGVLFTARDLPSWTYDYIRWNPMLHPIEGMRDGWFQAYESPVVDLYYTWTITLPAIALGLVLERRSRSKISFG